MRTKPSRTKTKVLVQSLIIATSFVSASASALVLDLTAVTTPFNNPIGIDYFEPTNEMVISVNYSSGRPYNFETVNSDGSHSQFSNISGLTNEVKIATAKGSSKFGAGTLFTGTGVNGQIIRINPDGTVHSTINLPGGDGLMRGSLFVDNTGVYDGDLIAVTTGGQVWRIDENGNGTLLADVDTHLEGLLVIPNDPAKWGSYAGKIIAGAENSSSLYSFDNDGNVKRDADIGVKIEDIDLIADDSNFFGVNYGTGRILGAAASQWDSVVGDILLTQEFHSGNSGLWTMSYDSVLDKLVTESVQIAAGSFQPGQWEHVAFGPAGIVEIPPVIPTPEPGLLALLATGLAGVGFSMRKRKLQ